MNFPSRIHLGFFPTPIEKLERLSRHLGGPEIYIKRDDQTGLATGGNKTRKLEFLLAEAQADGCDHLVTLGGEQSNHCRQTAAAAAGLGLRCSVVLRGHPPEQTLGNLLLDELLGADIHWSRERTREAVADELVATLRTASGRPYFVPLGGSTPRGALGYVAGMREALGQLKAAQVDIDAMIVASSSAGTQAGLALGATAFGYSGRLVGISIDATAADLTERVSQIAVGAGNLLKLDVTAEQLGIEVNDDYLGGGYAVVGDLEREAIYAVARAEGLLLDPVYTSRAMGGLIDLIRNGVFVRGQRILFWHTGGTAALSAFAGSLGG